MTASRLSGTSFFDDPTRSRGAPRIPLEHQGDDPARGELPENARWIHDGVVFVTVHVVGSANATWAAQDGTETEQREPSVRTEAAARWARETFDTAEASGARAVVVSIGRWWTERQETRSARSPGSKCRARPTMSASW
jgi:hypothetical protein